MKDTIYRADAIEAIRNVMCNKIGSWYDLAVFAIEALSALPSADAVEVIHDTEWVALRRNEYEDFLASADAVQG